MDILSDAFTSIQDALGGGSLTLWLVVAGVVLLWLAVKAVKLVVRLALGAVAAALLLGTAPWAATPVAGDAAACASAAVAAELGWQTHITKRVTVEELSSDAACEADGTGLANGMAVVRLRTFYDLPFQTWDVTAAGAESRFALPA